MEDPMTPLEKASAILGEHFEHYVICVNDEPHSVRIEYDNSLTALGMLKTANTLVSKHLLADPEDDLEIIWDDDEEEEVDDDS